MAGNSSDTPPPGTPPGTPSGEDETADDAHHGALHVRPGVQAAPSINPNARRRPRRPLTREALVEGVRRGDRVVLGRAITLLESTRPDHQALAQDVLTALAPAAGAAVRVGVTGVPGVGKSSFIEALGTLLTARGHRLAVLAIDPSSERTRGSILGDKTRMAALSADPNAFIRPSPTSGSLGGVARATRETMLLCEAAGYDVIFVETVGVGQSEITVHSMVDFFLLLALTGAGDELQGIKRGIMEMADAIAVTKADGANRAQSEVVRGQLHRALKLFPPAESGWTPRVMTCSAQEGTGLEEVWATIEAYVAHARETGYWETRRRRQARYWMHQTIEQQLKEHFFRQPAVRAARARIEAEVEAGRQSPFAAAQALLRIYEDAGRRPSGEPTGGLADQE